MITTAFITSSFILLLLLFLFYGFATNSTVNGAVWSVATLVAICVIWGPEKVQYLVSLLFFV